MPDGVWRTWHTPRLLETQIEFERGRKHGIAVHWYENGQMATMVNYHEGAMHGRWRSWAREGNPWSDVGYQHGLMHGHYIAYHDYQGKKKFQATFEKGRACGKVTCFEYNGDVVPCRCSQMGFTECEATETGCTCPPCQPEQ